MKWSKADEELAARGAGLVRLAAWALIAMSVLTVLVYVVVVGPGKLSQQSVRLLLTVGLASALIRGFRWARWLAVLLVLLGCLTAVGQVLALSRSGVRPFLPIVVLAAMSSVYVWVGRLLLWSPEVSAFFRGEGFKGKGAAPGYSDLHDV
jgi:hypothetical protein